MSSTDRPPAVFLMGATASGKTALALEIAERFGAEIVSVDSSLVYRGLDIGSAKPDPATLIRFPHALVDIREPQHTYSAGEFVRDADDAISAIHERGRLPLLVGGTGLYFRALERGLSPLPVANASLRQMLADEAAVCGWPKLHARLATRDPAAARRIHPNDTQRIGRALEVIELSGQRLSDQQNIRLRRNPSWRILKLAVATTDRAQLHARIAMRLDMMWEAGFLEEVRRLMELNGFDACSPSMRAVGYRQALEHLRGVYDFDECQQRALHASRQFAKRQLTWLRSERDVIRVEAGNPHDAVHRVSAFLR